LTRADKYAEAKGTLATIFHENKGRYGYRRITAELRRRGFTLNHKTVQVLMKQMGLVCRVRAKKYHSYKGEVGKIAPNQAIPADAESKGYPAEHEPQGKLSGQRRD